MSKETRDAVIRLAEAGMNCERISQIVRLPIRDVAYVALGGESP